MTKKFEELVMTDDFMFGKVMENNELCRHVLEILLQTKIETLEYPDREKEIRVTGKGKSVRLDIFTKDEHDIMYDAEMQNLNNHPIAYHDLPRRSRFYQAAMDTDHLKKKQSYRSLPETDILFICTFDPFGKGLPKYTFRNKCEELPELKDVMSVVKTKFPEANHENFGIGSTIFAVKPGDGSAREQAASCQKVLGGWANIANEYATKRYRSNLINWGMLPFIIPEGELPFANGDYIWVPGIRKAVEEKPDVITAYAVKDGGLNKFTMTLGDLTDDEREIILKGCLINYNRVS